MILGALIAGFGLYLLGLFTPTLYGIVRSMLPRKAPSGFHVVKRGGKVFVRRNPKPKEVTSGE